MNYDEKTLINAYSLHQKLLIQGEIQKKKNPELYLMYSDPDIREVINRIFLPVDEAIIVRADETLYFVPNVENNTYSFTNEELRKEMKLPDNKTLYFAQFIWINVISEFYGDQFLLTGETRSFVKVDEILNKVKEYIAKFEKVTEEERNELSFEYELDIQGLIDVWHSLSEVTDKVKDVSRAYTKDYGFFLKVLNFWEDEKLIVVKEKEEIVMTEKMKNIVGSYYHQETRINEIKKLLNELK